MSAAAFELPRALEACEPPEARGLARDGVRLLVARRREESIEHHVFSGLPDLLCPGDLLVVNVSATVPAAMGARRSDGTPLRVHFSSRAPRLEQAWRVVELRSADGARPIRAQIGELIRLDGGGELELVAPYAASVRLSLARMHGPSSVDAYLASHGEPIRYGYVTGRWALSTYQNVYATTPGSAEMPSAGRPFTPELITRLVARGILLAPITLHAAVSSPERHEPPLPEAFEVPVHTARLLRTVRAAGGRVIAVGTTVVRALETAAAGDGSVTPRTGWTDLLITPERGLRAIDGLITGWHEPEASHLQMLEAAAGPELLTRSYDAALEHGYLWHEFGDSHLILP